MGWVVASRVSRLSRPRASACGFCRGFSSSLMPLRFSEGCRSVVRSPWSNPHDPKLSWHRQDKQAGIWTSIGFAVVITRAIRQNHIRAATKQATSAISSAFRKQQTGEHDVQSSHPRDGGERIASAAAATRPARSRCGGRRAGAGLGRRIYFRRCRRDAVRCEPCGNQFRAPHAIDAMLSP